MKISERTVKRLGEIITGDKGILPYRGGPKLVSFFNECGTNHTYGQGFPSRWMFAEECIRQFNDTQQRPLVSLSQLPDDARFVRLLFLTRVSSADHDQGTLAAPTMQRLEAL